MNLEELVKTLHDALGERLKSVLLYGSAAAGDYLPGVSGMDVLIVAEPFGQPELAAIAPHLRQWERSGNPLPELFTPAELATSLDVFPIELLDMQQSRRVLFGSDPLASITIDMNDYRRQLEHELKTRLLQLRRSYLAAAGDEPRLARLMGASLSTFLVLMRAALRLYNDPVGPDKTGAIDRLAKHVQYDPQPLNEVLAYKKRQAEPQPGEIQSLFARYLATIEQIVHAVDQHLREATSPVKSN
jgi:hypothetical protein